MCSSLILIPIIFFIFFLKLTISQLPNGCGQDSHLRTKTVLGRNLYKVRNFKRRFYLWPVFFKVKQRPRFLNIIRAAILYLFFRPYFEGQVSGLTRQ